MHPLALSPNKRTAQAHPMVYRALLALSALGAAVSQMVLPAAPGCEWATLNTRVATLDSVCCTAGTCTGTIDCW